MAKADFSKELVQLRKDMEDLKGNLGRMDGGGAIGATPGFGKLLKDEDKRVLTNEMNIEKLKELVILLNKEIINYRKQVERFAKNKDVMKALEEMSNKFATIEKDKDYTKAMVEKVHSISNEVNQKFSSFQGSADRLRVLQEKLDHISESVASTQQKTHDIVTNAELKSAITDYQDNVAHQIRVLQDQVKRTTGKGGGVEEIGARKVIESYPKDLHAVHEALHQHQDKTRKELEGLKSFVQKNLSNHGETANIHQQMDHIEMMHNKDLQRIHQRSQVEDPHIVKNHIAQAESTTKNRINEVRNHIVGLVTKPEKVDRLRSALKARQISEPRENQIAQSAVDITLGKMRGGDDEREHIREEFQALKSRFVEENQVKSEKDTVDEVDESLDHLDFSGLGINHLHSSVDMIHQHLDRGDVLAAKQQYKKAYDQYISMREKDVEGLNEAYDALMRAYHKIVK